MRASREYRRPEPLSEAGNPEKLENFRPTRLFPDRKEEP